MKLKQVSDIRASNVDKLTVPDQTPVLLCNYTDVYKNRRISTALAKGFMPATASNLQIAKLTLMRGDIVLTKDSEAADDIAVPSLIIEDLENVVCGYHLALVRPMKIGSEFLALYLESISAKTQTLLSARGFTRFGLGVGEIGAITVTVPPDHEQLEICAKLNEALASIERSNILLSNSIQFLTEYKKSLIHHVVMGKVQV